MEVGDAVGRGGSCSGQDAVHPRRPEPGEKQTLSSSRPPAPPAPTAEAPQGMGEGKWKLLAMFGDFEVTQRAPRTPVEPKPEEDAQERDVF